MNEKFTKIDNDFIDRMGELSGSAVKIYIALRKFADWNGDSTEGNVFPSYPTLMKMTGLARASISKGIKELEKKGWISEIKHRFGDSNIYSLGGGVVQKMNYSSSENELGSSKTELSVVQKLNPNENHLTRDINKNHLTRTKAKGKKKKTPEKKVVPTSSKVSTSKEESSNAGINLKPTTISVPTSKEKSLISEPSKIEVPNPFEEDDLFLKNPAEFLRKNHR